MGHHGRRRRGRCHRRDATDGIDGHPEATLGPGPCAIDLTVAYSEKSRTLDVRTDSDGPPGNPLDNPAAPDDLGRILIETYARDIVYTRQGSRNRLTMTLK